MRFLTLPLTILALAAAGCGSSDDKTTAQTGTTSTPPTASTPTTQTTTSPTESIGADLDAVKATVLKWTFEGDCDTMTDKFLKDQAFIGDNRKERCDYFEKQFQKPQYSEDDLKFRHVEVHNDTAAAVVGSDIANITTKYTLLRQGGSWKIDSAD
jgi:hypothetical protein